MIASPFGINILIEPFKKKEIAVGEDGTLNEYGKVLAIGKDVKYIAVGDVVGFTVWGIQKLMVDDEVFYLVPEKDEFILATLHE